MIREIIGQTLCFNSLWRPSTHAVVFGCPWEQQDVGDWGLAHLLCVLLLGLLWCEAEVKCALIKWYFTLEELVSHAWPDGDDLNNPDAQLVVLMFTAVTLGSADRPLYIFQGNLILSLPYDVAFHSHLNPKFVFI